jgi:hypothetical protein
MMSSSSVVTLFTVQPPPRRGPSAFLVSLLVHGVAFALLLLGLRRAPHLEDRSLIQRYTVRLLSPPKLERQKPQSARGGITYSGSQNDSLAPAPGGSPAALSYVPPQVAPLHPAPQTLVQPDAPPDLQLAQVIPIPVVVMWSSDNTPFKKIVPPPPQKPTAADVLPAIIKPNREPNLADLKISTTPFRTQAPTLPPSTTSPVVVRRPEPTKQIPVTSSVTSEQPIPARVMSLSDIQSREPVMIPLANQTAQSISSESLTLGLPEKSAGAGGSGNPASKQNGVGAGEGPGNQASKQNGNGVAANSGAQGAKAAPGSGSIAGNGANTGAAPGSGGGSGSGAGSGSIAESDIGSGSVGGSGIGSEPSVTRITLPKDGQFGVVVVGSSLAEQYPETVEIWKGRLVYTVYLHVGLSKNWILQYSLPRTEAAATASVTRPDAPWPYDILRPDLLPTDFNSDAIMVHGFINLAGAFERLAVVFPPDFTQAKFLLSALKRWHFRPASQAGQVAAVEVLLIIPETAE